MIIDCHAHLVPPSLLESIRSQAAGFLIRLIEDGSPALPAVADALVLKPGAICPAA
jgi:hypothetical protein